MIDRVESGFDRFRRLLRLFYCLYARERDNFTDLGLHRCRVLAQLLPPSAFVVPVADRFRTTSFMYWGHWSFRP